MFIAKSFNQESVNLLGLDDSQFLKIKEQKWFCPSCHQQVILKCGKYVRAHFAHLRTDKCQNFSEGETSEHLSGKALLAKWCRQENVEYQLEAYLPELKQRPDLLLSGKIVIEFQCSSISVANCVARTQNYLKHGYQVIWIVGKKLWLGRKIKALQRGMIQYSENMGNYFWQLDVESDYLNCLFHIEEHVLRNQMYHSQQQFTLMDRPINQLLSSGKKLVLQSNRAYNLNLMLTKTRRAIDLGLLRRHRYLLKLQGMLYQEGSNLKLLADEFLLPVSSFLLTKESVVIWRFYFWKLCQKMEGQLLTDIIFSYKRYLYQQNICQHELPLINEHEALKRFISETITIFLKYQRIKIIDECVYLLKVSALKKESQEWRHRVTENTPTDYHISTLPFEDMVRYSYY